jgi:putative tributyrin esterase
MKKLLLACWILLLTQALALGQEPAGATTSRVRDATFHSQALGRDVHYRLLLPKGYDHGGRFPVLYLLHGLYGDYLNWDTRTHLEDDTRDLPLLIVMPDAGDSWYTNSATVPADRFEDYIVKDLIAEIDQNYHTIRDRHQRAIAGLSMGGYGAIKFGLKYPDLFVFAGSLSGALNAAQNLDELRPEFRDKLVEVFGKAPSRVRTDNDVFQILKSHGSTNYPYFYLACGTSDFFLTTNRAFVEQLSSSKIPYEYHETPGAHSWEYWDGAVKPLLEAVEKVLTAQAAPEK